MGLFLHPTEPTAGEAGEAPSPRAQPAFSPRALPPQAAAAAAAAEEDDFARLLGGSVSAVESITGGMEGLALAPSAAPAPHLAAIWSDSSASSAPLGGSGSGSGSGGAGEGSAGSGSGSGSGAAWGYSSGF